LKVQNDAWLVDAGLLPEFPEPKEKHTDGSIDLRVFMQDEFWVNITGDVFKLESMDREYLVNVLGFIFNEAENYQVAILDWYATNIMLFMNDYLKPSEQERQDFIEEATKCIDMTAHTWLAKTPLVVKIESLLD
jgi:hypothetical protein